MAYTVKDVAKLRALTNISIGKCKDALENTDGDMDKAIDFLRKSGAATAAKRADKEVGEGAVICYSHGYRLGVIVQLGCETDFVAKNEDFAGLGKDIAMHIAATNPRYISPDDVSQVEIDKEIEIYEAQLEKENKPAEIMEKILKGKVKKYREENALLSQSFVKNPDITIAQLLEQNIAKMGENIRVIDFKRLSS